MNEIANLIGSMGFPIVACIGMGYYIKCTNTENNNRIDKIQETQQEELKALTQAINNNTLVITQLSEKLADLTK